MFAQTHYFGSLAENATLGTSILKVTATDVDQGENGLITYSLHSKQSTSSSASGHSSSSSSSSTSSVGHFGINRHSGWIYLARPLDDSFIASSGSAKDCFELIALARDSGAQPLETSTLVTLRVLHQHQDRAQIELLFLTPTSKPEISESALVGDLVARVTVGAGRSGAGGSGSSSSSTPTSAHQVTLGDQGFNKFTLKPADNGQSYLIVVNGQLDRESKSRYTLTIQVDDSSSSSSSSSPVNTTFDLDVLDVNDNEPKFDQPAYHTTLPEAADIGTSVFQMVAQDADSDSILSYAFLVERNSYTGSDFNDDDEDGEESGGRSGGNNLLARFNTVNRTHRLSTRTSWFSIDTRSGLVVTRAQVDCETEAEPKLFVFVTDQTTEGDWQEGRSHGAVAVLTVAISDVSSGFCGSCIFDDNYGESSASLARTVPTQNWLAFLMATLCEVIYVQFGQASVNC